MSFKILLKWRLIYAACSPLLALILCGLTHLCGPLWWHLIGKWGRIPAQINSARDFVRLWLPGASAVALWSARAFVNAYRPTRGEWFEGWASNILDALPNQKIFFPPSQNPNYIHTNTRRTPWIEKSCRRRRVASNKTLLRASRPTEKLWGAVDSENTISRILPTVGFSRINLIINNPAHKLERR